MTAQERLAILRQYSLGQLGTRQVIDRLGMHDYADLVIELARGGLAFPKPEDTLMLRAHRERARAILQPRLRHGA